MRKHRNVFLLAIVCLILLLSSPPALAQKTDVITFRNGDQLTVDIKEFIRGKLRATTIGLGTIYIEWQVIQSVETSKIYQVELSSGARLLGTIKRADAGAGMNVLTASGPQAVDFADVAQIQRVKRDRSIWDRIDGSVQWGLNYTSGSEIGQANFGLNAYFLEAKYAVGTDLNGTFTTGSATNDTQRYNWGVNYYRLLQDRWFWLANTTLDSNDQLGIDLRLLAGGGVGRFLIKNNSSRWMASAGLAASRELRLDNNQTQIEGQLITEYSYYFFAPKKTDLNFILSLYPGLTQSDRLRGNFDTTIRWEIIKDFTLDLTYFFSWDNQPPQGAASNDTGVTTSIGYTF